MASMEVQTNMRYIIIGPLALAATLGIQITEPVTIEYTGTPLTVTSLSGGLDTAKNHAINATAADSQFGISAGATGIAVSTDAQTAGDNTTASATGFAGLVTASGIDFLEVAAHIDRTRTAVASHDRRASLEQIVDVRASAAIDNLAVAMVV